MSKYELTRIAMTISSLFKVKKLEEYIKLTKLIELLINNQISEEEVLSFIKENGITLK